jgi:hypothetical protein
VGFVEILVKAGVKVWYCLQTPGTMVCSPSTPKGACHLVVSKGPVLIHSAWNSKTSLAAFSQCLHLFPSPPDDDGNDASITRKVLPVKRMQRLGLNLGLEAECMQDELLAEAASYHQKRVRHYTLEPLEQDYCIPCGRVVDLLSIDNLCAACFAEQQNKSRGKKKSKKSEQVHVVVEDVDKPASKQADG